jgi:hypothetical protein
MPGAVLGSYWGKVNQAGLNIAHRILAPPSCGAMRPKSAVVPIWLRLRLRVCLMATDYTCLPELSECKTRQG